MERKLSTKVATGLTTGEIAKLGRDKRQPLYTIIGIASGIKENNHAEYGISYGLIGNFESIAAATGETKRAPVYWPPAFLAEVMMAGMVDGAVVRFAFTIGVEPTDEGQLGFRYWFETLIETKEADLLGELRLLALPAPNSKDKKDAK